MITGIVVREGLSWVAKAIDDIRKATSKLYWPTITIMGYGHLSHGRYGDNDRMAIKDAHRIEIKFTGTG